MAANRGRIGLKLFCPTAVVNHRSAGGGGRCRPPGVVPPGRLPIKRPERSESGSGVPSPRRPAGRAGFEAEQELLHNA